jgi:hypothetical protein
MVLSGFIMQTDKEFYNEDERAKSITINYSDGSGYTIKTEGYAQITRVNDKREYKLHIDYLRKPATVKSSADYLVKELESVKERVELKLKDVKSMSVREDDRTITLTKFK